VPQKKRLKFTKSWLNKKQEKKLFRQSVSQQHQRSNVDGSISIRQSQDLNPKGKRRQTAVRSIQTFVH
jgi:hypothetical protein